MTTPKDAKPHTVLIAAMGGEGGGVLTNWLVSAATKAGRIVQSTSIPGVAQRTGATTYYVEIWPDSTTGEPISALYPTPGEVDIMVASELIEAGRALQNGYVSPDRTLLVASTHRVFSMDEKTAMGDGRFDAGRVTAAARKLAKRPMLADLDAAAKAAGAAINAVMLGAIARAGDLPISEDAFRDAITDSGIAVAANLAGFDAGLALSGEGAESDDVPIAPTRSARESTRDDLLARARAATPEALAEFLVEGVNRLAEYQDWRYARRYLDHLEAIIAADPTRARDVARETARYLALHMSYEDVIRVAQLKIRPERLARIHAEVAAAPGQPVRVSEFLKPGVDELCALLPGFLARPILAWADRRGLSDKLNVGIRLNSGSITGYLVLKMLAGLRPLRRLGFRYAEDQRRIEDWLDLIEQALGRDADFALEIAKLARLIKGYGETHQRGVTNYQRIRDAVVRPVVANASNIAGAAERLRSAAEAALADPSGDALAAILAEVSASIDPVAAKAAE